MPDIALMGAEYHDVPAVYLPKVGGGSVRFQYGESPSGGNANISQDEDGYIVIDDVAPSGGGVTLIERGTFTPVADVRSHDTPIPHALGVMPDFIIVRTNLDTSASETLQRIQTSAAWVKDFTSAQASGDSVLLAFTTRPGLDASWVRNYTQSMSLFCDASMFYIPFYSSNWDYLAGGYTYEYIIGKVVAT